MRFSTFVCAVFAGLTLLAAFSGERAYAAPLNNSGVATLVAESAEWDPAKPFFDLRHEAWVYGPTFRTLDGREDGPGTQISIDHLLKAGYYLGDGWKLRLYQPFVQKFAHPSAEARSWTAMDPRVGFGKSGILTEEKHGVEWKLVGFYSVPVSSQTKKNVGGDYDMGDGRILLDSRLAISRRITGPVWTEFRWFGYQGLKKNPLPTTLDKRFELYNRAGINPTEKTDVYVGYNNYLNWYRDGLRDPWKKSQALELGATYYFTPETSINPFVETPFHLKDTAIWLYFEARFI